MITKYTATRNGEIVGIWTDDNNGPGPDHWQADWGTRDGVVVTASDFLAEQQAAAIRSRALAYLQSTDWQVIRQLDNGTPMDEEVKVKRAECRGLL